MPEPESSEPRLVLSAKEARERFNLEPSPETRARLKRRQQDNDRVLEREGHRLLR